MALAIYGFVAPKRRIEAAGISYEFSVIKDRLALGLSTLPILRVSMGNGGTNGLKASPADDDAELLLDGPADWLDKEDAKYRKYISRLDPNHWKEQDHYKVLGLSKMRYQATQAQLKTAYRRKVLKYHPDKGQAASQENASLRNEAVFACIQKAYEQLGLSEERRHAFDSVDPTFDEGVPETINANAKEFFKVLGPVFERNARFSVNQPVPLLGDENSNRSHVEHFYEFWFDWRSWRDFSYLDAEDKSKGEDRWERREIEKQNKVEREKRRKKDLKRISALVELAYSKDPRVSRFKEEDKRKKEELKEQRRRERELREQADLEQRRREEEAAEQERKAREEEERRAAQVKQQKKKALTAKRRRLRDLAAASNYWAQNGTEKIGKDQQTIMEQIERICLSAEFDELDELCEGLTAIQTTEEALQLFSNCACRNGSMNGRSANGTEAPPSNTQKKTQAAGIWSPTELQLLIKGVNLYPPGTQERWKQVAEYVSYHGDQQRSERDVIKQVKLLKSDLASNSMPAAQIKDASKLETETASGGKPNELQPSASPVIVKAAPNEEEWSAEQQKQLERALKETPASDAARWDKIAAMVPGKGKKECIRRYKRLSEMVRQAKNQQQ